MKESGLISKKAAMDRDDSTAGKLPESLRSLFWDVDFDLLRLGEYDNFVIRRVLDCGGWESMKWLRRTLGDDAIRQWFLAKKGGGLEPAKLRYWELILDLPRDQVDEWVREARNSIWYRRTQDEIEWAKPS